MTNATDPFERQDKISAHFKRVVAEGNLSHAVAARPHRGRAMSTILRSEFPNPPPDRHASEGGASPGAPLAMPPGEASIRLLCKTLERAAKPDHEVTMGDFEVMNEAERKAFMKRLLDQWGRDRAIREAREDAGDYRDEKEGDWTR